MTDTTPYIRSSLIGVDDGIASLDAGGQVPIDELGNLPPYVPGVGSIIDQFEDTSGNTSYAFGAYPSARRLDGGSGGSGALTWNLTFPTTGKMRAEIMFSLTVPDVFFNVYLADPSGFAWGYGYTLGGQPNEDLVMQGFVDTLIQGTPGNPITLTLWGISDTGAGTLMGATNPYTTPLIATFYIADVNAGTFPYSA
jgi:hypothetical protein